MAKEVPRIFRRATKVSAVKRMLAGERRRSPLDRRARCKRACAIMQPMTTDLPQGELTIALVYDPTGLSRAGYYWQWRASAPRQEEMGVRDAIQRIALEHKYY